MRWLALVMWCTACGGGGAVASDDAAVRDTAEPDLSTAPLLPGERVVTIPTRAGVTIAFAVQQPASPRGAVVLFTGSDGLLRLSRTHIGAAADNFVIRTRQHWADAGFLVAALDAPSDHASGLGNGYRTSEAGASDVAAVLAWLRARTSGPVWLVGTSRGTISAANATARLGKHGPDGLVLTSSITSGSNATLYDVALADVRVPTLLVHHRMDACPASPFDGAAPLAHALTGVPRQKLEPFDGGGPVDAQACGPISYHGYIGLDEAVLAAILKFVG
jgi:hypothetical protein